MGPFANYCHIFITFQGFANVNSLQFSKDERVQMEFIKVSLHLYCIALLFNTILIRLDHRIAVNKVEPCNKTIDKWKSRIYSSYTTINFM